MNVAEKRLGEMESKFHSQVSELELKLQAVANMTAQQAKDELLNALTEDAQKDMLHGSRKLKRNPMRRLRAAPVGFGDGDRTLRKRSATERTVSSIPLKGEEMKGKIIVAKAATFRALEAACGVDLIIDETPETVIISSFDPVRP